MGRNLNFIRNRTNYVSMFGMKETKFVCLYLYEFVPMTIVTRDATRLHVLLPPFLLVCRLLPSRPLTCISSFFSCFRLGSGDVKSPLEALSAPGHPGFLASYVHLHLSTYVSVGFRRRISLTLRVYRALCVFPSLTACPSASLQSPRTARLSRLAPFSCS